MSHRLPIRNQLGERGLRALGGHRAAERFPARQDAALDGPALARALEARAAGHDG